MSATLQTASSCGAGSPGGLCASTSVASDAGGGVLSGLSVSPVVSALFAAALLLAFLVFVVWVVRRVSTFVDVGLLSPLLFGVDRSRADRRDRDRSRSLADDVSGRSISDDDDREVDDEDDEEDEGMGANKRGVQGGLT